MTEPAHAGLLTKGTPIPLEGVAIDAEIRDFCSRVTVTTILPLDILSGPGSYCRRTTAKFR
jgi:hypothetical protein